MSNILDPSALLHSLPDLLPGSSPKLSSPQDGLTAIIHTVMATLAFRLVAIDDSSPTRSVENNVLPDGWNAHGPGNYTLRYRHEQSSLEYLVKVSKLGGRTLINAIAIESDKTVTLDMPTNDFVSPSFFPYTLNAPGAQPLVQGFISSNRIADFVSQYTLKIVKNLVPGLQKEGYVEVPADSSTNSASSVYHNQPRQNPPPARPQTPPENPGQPFRLPSHIPPENPLQIGRRDLDPIASQNPFAPPSLFPHSSGDGMFVGPEHPIFRGGLRGPDRGMGGIPGRGPWGGDGFLPPMGAPPGARFDPVGPFQGGMFGGRGGRGSGPRGPGFGGPDNDEFMPPGSDDMFS